MISSRLKLASTLILAVAMCHFAMSQDLSQAYISNYRVEDGLAQSNVSAIHIDSDGFVWVGTDDGLNRYDSHDFITYRNDPQDSFSISENEVISILEDSNGHLWIGTAQGGGINRYDRETGRFYRYLNDVYDIDDERINQRILTLAQNTALCIKEDEHRNIWVGTHDGIWVLQNGNEKFEKIWATSNIQVHVRDIDFTDDGAVLLATESGLGFYYPDTDSLLILSHTDDINSISNNSVQSILADGDVVWVCTLNGFNKYNLRTERFERFGVAEGLSSPITLSVRKNEEERLWIGTDGEGLWEFDQSAKKFARISTQGGSLDKLSIKAMSRGESNLWIGTVRDGLFAVKTTPKRFEHFEVFHPQIEQLGKNTILDFAEDNDGNVWIGTDGGGLFKQDISTGEFIAYSANDSQNPLSSNVAKSIEIDDLGNVLIGTYAGGLNYLDTKTGEVKVFRNDPMDSTSISNDNVWAIHQDSKGRIWCGTLYDLNLFDRDTESFKRYPAHAENSNAPVSSVIFDIHEDMNGDIWLTSPDGLSLYQEETDDFKRFIPNSERPADNYLKDIVEDQNGDLWITSKNKVYCFRAGEFLEPMFNHKLQAAPNSILIDQESRFWIGTSNGLYRLDGDGTSVRVYDVGDGTQSNEFKPGASLISSTGDFYMGGLNGYNVFKPNEVGRVSHEPVPVLTGIFMFHHPVSSSDREYNFGDINYSTGIELTYDQNVLSLTYAAIDHDYPNNNQYAYRLNGFDEEWNMVEDQQMATYTNLPAGSYTFEVKSTNKEGKWSVNVKKLDIEIVPPFWNTIWFKVIGVLVLGLGIWLAYLWRVRAVLDKKRALEEAIEERTHELSAEVDSRMRTEEELQSTLDQLKATQDHLVQSEKMASIGTLAAGIAHEINNPLNYAFGGLDMLKQLIKQHNLDNSAEFQKQFDEAANLMHDGISRSATIIKSLMMYSRNGKSGSNEVVSVDFNEILDSVRTYLKTYILDGGIELKYELNEQLMLELIPNKMSQVMLNLIGNAVDATMEWDGERKIMVKAVRNEQQANIIVENTGPSISEAVASQIYDPFFTTKEAGKGTGLGLWVTYQIIEEHQGNIEVENIDGGVRFTVTIPQTSSSGSDSPSTSPG